MRECNNCKFGRGIGSDVWCGHEPKGNESYMYDTDCPYWTTMNHATYEWSEKINGINMTFMTEPKYYAQNGLSPLGAFKKGLLSEEELIGFYKGNVIKYTVRAGKKDNASEDIDKAIDYLNYLKEILV